MSSIRARVSRLERIQPPPAKEYRFDLTIILDDDATDDYIQERQKAEPYKRFIRFSDFVDECI
jgi:hypothetical protein